MLFDSTSVISQVNQNRDIRVDTLFQKVFKKALEVSAETNGAYDVTCAPLINLWGFGFSRKDSVTPAHIDSVRQFIGFQKVRLEGDRIVKDDPRLSDELFFFGGWNGLRYDSPNAGEERGP